MENNIKEAIKLLENNGYFVAKVPEDKDLCSNARECMETGHGHGNNKHFLEPCEYWEMSDYYKDKEDRYEQSTEKEIY